MNKKNTLARMPFVLPIILLALPVTAIFLSGREGDVEIINFHESVESLEEVQKLLNVMENTDIDMTVLNGIPSDLIRYSEGDEVDYSGLEGNNEMVVLAAAGYPDKIKYFCAVDPSSSNVLEEIENCVKNGAAGIKIYEGYSLYHNKKLDDPDLLKIYSKISELDSVLMMPVSLYKDDLKAEFENVLVLNPDLKVICPHYCLSSKNLIRLTDLMDKFPNLYVDISFGQMDYAITGFETISANINSFTDFFTKFQDRILFATDNVVTGYISKVENKTEEWLTKLFSDYYSMLSSSKFYSKSNKGIKYTGLNLSDEILKKVLWTNASNLLK